MCISLAFFDIIIDLGYDGSFIFFICEIYLVFFSTMSFRFLLLAKYYLSFQGTVGYRNTTWEGRFHHNVRQDRESAIGKSSRKVRIVFQCFPLKITKITCFWFD